MQLKINLHSHTSEDEKDGYIINYNIFKLIDRAKVLGFGALALTGHKTFLYKKEYGEYARDRGIILLPGIELYLRRFFIFSYHIIVLNCGPDVEKVKNIEELAEYKNNNPRSFIIAPHPNFGFFQSIGIKKLVEHIDLFDAVEHAWFYSKRVNRNKKTKRIAEKFKKPFIATSDIHTLKYLDTDYAVVEADSFSTESILKAIKRREFYNVTQPKKTYELIFYIIWDTVKFALVVWPRSIVLWLLRVISKRQSPTRPGSEGDKVLVENSS